MGCRAEKILYCWGRTAQGQGHFEQGTRPFRRAARAHHWTHADDAVRIIGSSNHTLLRTTSGELFCWGNNNRHASGIQPAVMTSSPMPAPRDGVLTDVYTATDNAHEAIAMALGDGFMCVVRRNKEIVCWGKSLQGQVGVGEAGTFIAPGIVQVSPIKTDDALRPSTQNPQNN